METNDEDVLELLGGWTKGNIQSAMLKRLELDAVAKNVETAKEILNSDIKAYLKERGWNKYLDDSSKISVDLTVIKREDIDRKKIKMLLSPTQYNSIVKISTYEKLSIVTPEVRERLKKMIAIKKPKNNYKVE
jgi:hypothetical protein